jgi:hypothetical protein
VTDKSGREPRRSACKGEKRDSERRGCAGLSAFELAGVPLEGICHRPLSELGRNCDDAWFIESGEDCMASCVFWSRLSSDSGDGAGWSPPVDGRGESEVRGNGSEDFLSLLKSGIGAVLLAVRAFLA